MRAGLDETGILKKIKYIITLAAMIKPRMIARIRASLLGCFPGAGSAAGSTVSGAL